MSLHNSLDNIDIFAVLILHDQKKPGEERDYFDYISIWQIIIKSSSGRNLEAETDIEATKDCYLLACFLLVFSDCFPIEPRTTSITN